MKSPEQVFIEEKYPDTKESPKPILERMERISNNPRAIERLGNLLMDKFVVDEQNDELISKLAEALYESEKKLAVNRGQGDDIKSLDDEEVLAKYREEIIKKIDTQKKTLGSWFDYLKESDDYPVWFKYYVVRSLAKMGQFNRENTSYRNRTEDTIAPFPELNSESLGFVRRAIENEFKKSNFDISGVEVELTDAEMEDIKEKVGEDKLEYAIKGRLRNKRREEVTKYRQNKDLEFVDNQNLNPERKEELTQELLKRLDSKDFAKLYAFAQVECAGNLDRESIEGEWVKYDIGSDYTLLEGALKGKGTGWCTASGSAQDQLQRGDFYVFFSKNKAGVPTEPRIAIRMEGDAIGEIRGINPGQELEPVLLKTAQEKYKELPGVEKYLKRDADMKYLTQIYNKCFTVDEVTQEKILVMRSLSKDDIRFIYEMDNVIEGFGYRQDPRIEEIKFTISNARSAEGLVLPEEFRGDLDLSSLTSAEGLVFPEEVGRVLDLRSLTSAEDLVLPKKVGGDLNLSSLTSAEGLVFPEEVGRVLDLRSLTSVEGLVLPKKVGGLVLYSLTSAEGLVLPKEIGHSLYLNGLKSTNGLDLAKFNGKEINLGYKLSEIPQQQKEELQKKYPNIRFIV
jgi:hypothetical protein